MHKPDIGARGRPSRVWLLLRIPVLLLFLALLACNSVNVAVQLGSPTPRPTETHNPNLPQVQKPAGGSNPQATRFAIRPSPTAQPTLSPPTPRPTLTSTLAPLPSATQAVKIAVVTATPLAPSAPTLTADERAVKALADQAIQALKNKDMETLAGLIDPTKGVRFSPYAFVNEEDRRYLPNPLKRAFADPQKYLWGHFDGSGEPIESTFKQYYERFVYSQDFANAPQVGVNQSFSQGNTVDNLADFYPEAAFVEYYFPGFDEKYAGMDWEALRLVFQQVSGQWRLVGIIHDQWTI